MNETSTQEPRTIGDPDRFVIDLQGNVHQYDTLTLCLERADGVIDLALSYERNRATQTGTRPPTMYSVLCSAQQELDDIRHVLHQWYNAGLPGDGEPVDQRAPTLEKVHDDNELAERRKAARIADEAIFNGAIFEKLTHAGAVADLLRTTKENEPFENTFKQTDDLLCCQISSAIKDLEDWYEQTPGAAQP